MMFLPLKDLLNQLFTTIGAADKWYFWAVRHVNLLATLIIVHEYSGLNGGGENQTKKYLTMITWRALY